VSSSLEAPPASASDDWVVSMTNLCEQCHEPPRMKAFSLTPLTAARLFLLLRFQLTDKEDAYRQNKSVLPPRVRLDHGGDLYLTRADLHAGRSYWRERRRHE